MLTRPVTPAIPQVARPGKKVPLMATNAAATAAVAAAARAEDGPALRGDKSARGNRLTTPGNQAIFGRIHFKPEPSTNSDQPLIFEDGTEQRRLARVIIEYGNTGVFNVGGHVVRQSKRGVFDSFQFNFASTGGKHKSPCIDTDTEEADDDVAAFRRHVVDSFKSWRRDLKARGVTSIIGAPKGIATTDEELIELGLMEPPKPAAQVAP